MAGCETVRVKILVCLAVWCALLANHRGAQCRTLSRIQHRQRHHDGERNEGRQHEGARRHHRRGDQEEADEDPAIRLDDSTRRLLEDQERYLEKLLVASSRSGGGSGGGSRHAMRKRHDGGSGNALYVRMRDSHMNVFRKAGGHPGHGVDGEYYEVEVKEAQNSSLCNYTVEAIPDKSADQSRRPKDLVNVKCNNLGSSCPHVDTHCCIQTYSTIDTSYANGTYESIKIYTGCVCSLMAFAELAPVVTKKPRLY